MEGRDTKSASGAERDLNSPRQRLQVAEMVMRKLYRKNLQTEEEVAKLKEENARLVKKMEQRESSARIGATANANARSQAIGRENTGNQSEEPAVPDPVIPCYRCASCPNPSTQHTIPIVPQIANPPSLESVNRIDQQQLDYLRHLAAEQDKTITSLKIRIEELSKQLELAKQPSSSSGRGGGGKSTPRQIVNRLQSKLQDALTESERQKVNYMKMKKDFQHLLGLKTKTLVENPAQLKSSARELLQLMEKKLSQIEHEHSQNLSLYNSKLYAVEQQTCESYVQKKMMEEEIQRIAQDVKQRDDVDVQIEHCMVGVFERLREVELENVLMKSMGTAAPPPTTPSTPLAAV